MAELKLNKHQAALILEVSEGGEIKVEVAANQSEDRENDLVTAICEVIATKLVNDEHFQEEIISTIYAEEGDDTGDTP